MIVLYTLTIKRLNKDYGKRLSDYRVPHYDIMKITLEIIKICKESLASKTEMKMVLQITAWTTAWTTSWTTAWTTSWTTAWCQ